MPLAEQARPPITVIVSGCVLRMVFFFWTLATRLTLIVMIFNGYFGPPSETLALTPNLVSSFAFTVVLSIFIIWFALPRARIGRLSLTVGVKSKILSSPRYALTPAPLRASPSPITLIGVLASMRAKRQ